MAEKQLKGKVIIESDTDGLKKITAASRNTETELKQLNNTGEKLGKTMKDASQANSVLTKDFQTLELRAADVDDTIRSLNRRLETYDAGSAEYKELGTMLDNTADEAKFLADIFKKLNSTLETSENLTEAERKELQLLTEELGDTHTFLKKTEDVLEDLNDGFDEFGREIEDTVTEVKQANAELKETKTVAQSLEGGIDELANKWRTHNRATIALKKQYKDWRKEGRHTAEELENLGKKIQDAQLQEMSMITQTRDLIHSHNALNGVLDDTSGEYGRLSLDLNHAEGYINGMNNAVRRGHKDMRTLNGSLGEVKNEVRGLGGVFQDAIAKMNTSLKPDALLIGAASAGFGALINLAQDAARAVIEFVKESLVAYSEFEQGFAQALTLVDGYSDNMKEVMSDSMRDAGKEMARMPEEYLPALYQALSLGIPEGNSIDAVKDASIAARAANADLTGTLISGQSIVNAYGANVYDLNRVYDLLFFAVKNGAVTIDELNQGMSEITSVAGEANVSLEDVASAVIVMTKQGDSFSEAASLMSNMLTQLQIEGTALGGAFKEASGVGFREFIAQGGNLAEALQMIEEHAKSTGSSMVELVGGDSPFFRDQQAMRGTLELTGKHMEEFIAISNEARDANGLVGDAYAEVADSMALAEAQTEATTEAMKIQIGEALEPGTRAWLGFQLVLAEGVSQIAKSVQGDYSDAVGQMIDDNIAAATSQEELVQTTLNMAEALGNSKWLGLFDLTGSSDEIQRSIKEIMASQIDLTRSIETVGDENMAVYESLKAVYGEALTLERGYIKLNGETIAYTGALYGMAVAQQKQIAQDNEIALMQQRQTGYIQDKADAVAALASETASADQEMLKYVTDTSNLYEVLEVLDGDTVRIELEGEVKDIRFRNINTPEIEHGDDAAMPWAYAAMDTTQAFFDENPLNLQGQMGRESYDRIIAEIPGLERDLVSSGLAIPLPVHMTEDPEAFKELEYATTRAAKAGIGLFEDQTLAARVLGGEMVELGAYYEEMAEKQTRLNSYFKEAKAPVETLTSLYEDLRTANETGFGIDEAKDAVIAGNAAIVDSYKTTAYEVYLAQNGATESTVAMGVAMGIFTEQEGLARLEFANTQIAIEDLILSQDDLLLTDQELIIATGLLIDGFANTPEAAAKAAKSYDGIAASSRGAGEAARATRQSLLDAQGDYSATFTTTYKTINKTVNEIEDSRKKVDNKYTGGRLEANTPYIVGDGPGGQLTPYSELFIPDQSGYLLDAQATKSLIEGNSPANATSAAATATTGDTIYEFTINIDGSNLTAEQTTEATSRGVQNAAAQIGF